MLFVWFCLFARVSSLQSVKLPLVRDLSVAYERKMLVDAQIGTPPAIYRLRLTTNASAPLSLFHCIEKMSSSYSSAASSDTLRLTQHSFMSDHRSLLRVSVQQRCNESDRTNRSALDTPEIDGVLSLRSAHNSLWSAYPRVTLTRNFITLSTKAAFLDDGISCNAQSVIDSSYCEFYGTIGSRQVLIALVIDTSTVVMPSWATENIVEIRSGGHIILVDMKKLRDNQNVRHQSIFQMAAPGDEDDDDLSISADKAELELQKILASETPEDVIRFEPRQTVVLGSAILAQHQIERQFFPVSSVWIKAVAIREHFFWYESALNTVFTVHFIGLVCHSAWLHSRYMSQFRVSIEDRILWLEVISLALTVAAVSFGMYLSLTELDGALRVYVAIQLVTNVTCVLLFAPTTLFQKPQPRQRSRLAYSTSSEQCVAVALLAISLVVRLNSGWRSLTSAFAAFLVLANTARSVYKAANLFAFRFSSARTSKLFRVFCFVVLLGVALLYSAVQLSISVLFVVLESIPLTLLVVAFAWELGTQFVDIYRESEMQEKRSGKTDQPAVIPF